MTSVFPEDLDVFTRLVNEFDRPTANWWNQIFSALRNIQLALGTNPSTLGTGFRAFTDVADILADFAKIEMGEFSLEFPVNVPQRVLFKSVETRFKVANKMFIGCNMKLNNSGRNVQVNGRHTARLILGPGPFSEPYGFDFYRFDMDNASGTADGHTETWQYIAIEDNL